MTYRLPLTVLLLGVGLSGSVFCAPLGTANAARDDFARTRFESLDANRDGVLSKYEYDSDVVFETADRNRDQLLSAEELQAAIGPQPADAPTAPERMIAVDLDRDGQLDDAELRRTLEMRFSWLDRNADGGLDFDEMKAGVGARVRP
ncbi:EF-hand domain-containing protein [Lysobacter soli]|uniref:EF-hand domain-containing protein n=1 Tax=Lysobacter soli TaxID=453783 RepID=UPI0037C5698B